MENNKTLKKFEDEPDFFNWLIAYQVSWFNLGIATYEPINFLYILHELGGESDDVVTMDEGYTLPAQWEYITGTAATMVLINPDNEDLVKIAQGLNERLQNYPALDEEWVYQEEEQLIKSAWEYSREEEYKRLAERLDPREVPDFFDGGEFSIPEQFQNAIEGMFLRCGYCESLEEVIFDVENENGYGEEIAGIEDDIRKAQQKLDFLKSPFSDKRQRPLIRVDYKMADYVPFGGF